MTKSSIAYTVAVLAFASVCSAAPRVITMDQINTTLPLEGAPLAIPGPYEVTAARAADADLFVIHPTKLDAFPAKDTLPVLVWGNGGCALNTERYKEMLSTIASHGFLVLGTMAPANAAPPAAGTQPRRATAEDLLGAINWAEKENARAGAPLKGKIALDKIAAMGQSCGGFLSITLGADPRVKTIGVFNSGIKIADPDAPVTPAPGADALTLVHGPVLLINGNTRDFLMENSLAAYDAIAKLPVFYGSRHDAGHTATAFHPGGGEFANVASNWVLWQFKGDKQASTMFVGKDCGLCTNKNWDTKSKALVAP